jgi:hypothetical protein
MVGVRDVAVVAVWVVEPDFNVQVKDPYGIDKGTPSDPLIVLPVQV